MAILSSVIDFCPWYTFGPQKLNHCTLSFFGAYGKGNGNVDTTTATQLTVQSQNCFTMMQEFMLVAALAMNGADDKI
jgi:hypothetical protein